MAILSGVAQQSYRCDAICALEALATLPEARIADTLLNSAQRACF